MDIYRKRGTLIKRGASAMEWKQYVFKIENRTLKYYKSNKVSNFLDLLKEPSIGSVVNPGPTTMHTHLPKFAPHVE